MQRDIESANGNVIKEFKQQLAKNKGTRSAKDKKMYKLTQVNLTQKHGRLDNAD